MFKQARIVAVILALATFVPVALAKPAAGRPRATTGPASAVRQTSAIVAATVNPRGKATTYRFQYGRTKAYGLLTATQSAGSGTTARSVSAKLTGLAPGTRYHYRVTARSVAGTADGHDRTFTTLPRLTISARPNPVIFGRSTAITGRLLAQGNGGQTIQLQANPFPFHRFVTVATTTTTTTGRYAFPRRRPARNTRFRTIKARRVAATSRTALVRVRIAVTRHVSDRTPLAGRRVRFTGFACPAHLGRTAAVQRRRSARRYVTVATTRLVAASSTRGCAHRSRYARRVRISRSGTYRVIVVHDADHATGFSPRVTLHVH